LSASVAIWLKLFGPVTMTSSLSIVLTSMPSSSLYPTLKTYSGAPTIAVGWKLSTKALGAAKRRRSSRTSIGRTIAAERRRLVCRD
jgi:hypothetical protein